MKKSRTREQWIMLFNKYENTGEIPKEYFGDLNLKNYSKAKKIYRRNFKYKIYDAQTRFKNKYKLWKIDNIFFMSKKIIRPSNKKRTKKEIEEVINNLTNEELKDIARRYIEITEKTKKEEAKKLNWKITRKAYLFGLHRTTFYKRQKERIYKFDFAKNIVSNIFNDNKKRYGSQRLSKALEKQKIRIDERTLRNYMKRWNLICITRAKKRNRESKNVDVEYPDLVQRNFNPKEDNIVATDVSYIPAKSNQNFVYLSIAISHKTKLIESWELGTKNNNQLVWDTISRLPYRKNGILHSDHAAQYSSYKTIEIKKQKGYLTSMGRIGNCLDNREAEYFFSCIKSEFLNHLQTDKMTYYEIYKNIQKYIEWYNTKRIQKRLQWNTPIYMKRM